ICEKVKEEIDGLKTKYPHLKIVASEALQCPTLLMNGFGGHRIEGIGDKHVPWVHNVRNTDAVAAVDDEDCMRVLRLFNELAGHEYLAQNNITKEAMNKLPLLGISSIGNMLAAIKTAKYFEMDENDVVFTIFTDSTELYGSRLEELRAERGAYTSMQAAKDHAGPLEHQNVEYFKELNYNDRKALHNLKYFTWVEQQGRTVEELNSLWRPEFWKEMFEDEVKAFDGMIKEFNALVERS
ncbi:MAG: pyridoxal-5-phosphate-dependent protein subunit beta, partial [bacterium]